MINWFGDVFLAEQSGRIEWPIGLFFWLVMGGSSRTATSQERRQAGHLISSFLPFSSIKSTKVEVDLIGLLNGNGAESEETNGKTTAPRASWLVVGYELPAPLRATTPKANSLLVPFLCGLACLLRKGKRRAHANHKPTKRGNPTLSLCLVLCWLRV